MTTPTAQAAPSPDTQSLTLPCGRTALVQAFSGNAQRILNEIHEAASEKRSAGDDVTERLLSEVTKTLSVVGQEPKHPTARDLLALPTGSRHRLLLASRVLSYGADVEIEHVCVPCRETTRVTFDLSRVFDVPYPEGVKSVKFEAGGSSGSGGHVFAIGFGTGDTGRAFQHSKRMKLWGMLDEPLSRVLTVDGAPMGPQRMLKLSGSVLDAVRRAGRQMVPTVLLDDMPEREVDAFDAIVTDPARMPSAGLSERVQIRCEHCGHVGVSSWVAAPDFLLRGTVEALND